MNITVKIKERVKDSLRKRAFNKKMNKIDNLDKFIICSLIYQGMSGTESICGMTHYPSYSYYETDFLDRYGLGPHILEKYHGWKISGNTYYSLERFIELFSVELKTDESLYKKQGWIFLLFGNNKHFEV